MTKEIFVKPAEGLKIRNPNAFQYYINIDGQKVVRTRAVVRLIRSGDLEEVKSIKTPAQDPTLVSDAKEKAQKDKEKSQKDKKKS